MFLFPLAADFNLSNLNVLTWRENYAGSSGLSAAKLPSDLLSTRITDGVMVRNNNNNNNISNYLCSLNSQKKNRINRKEKK